VRWLSGLLVALAILVSSPAAAWCRMTTSLRRPSVAEPCILPDPATDPPEQFLEWRRPCTAITLSAVRPSNDLSEEDVYAAINRSVATWEGVACGGAPIGFDIGVLAAQNTCTAPLFRNDGGNTNQIMFIDDWAERGYDLGAFALTTVWHRRSTGEILDVDMEINESRGPYRVCPATGCDGTTDRGVDLENVLTHELGHYLGLAHSTDMDATMFASAVAGETVKRDLDIDDIAGICEIYPPGTFTEE